MPDPYLGILAAIFLYALGGGLIIHGLPIVLKIGKMLHAAAPVAISTICVRHRLMAGSRAWATRHFRRSMPRIVPEGTATMRFADLPKTPVFYLMFLMMLCAGAAGQGMSQWASAFAESGLGVTSPSPDDGPVPRERLGD